MDSVESADLSWLDWRRISALPPLSEIYFNSHCTTLPYPLRYKLAKMVKDTQIEYHILSSRMPLYIIQMSTRFTKNLNCRHVKFWKFQFRFFYQKIRNSILGGPKADVQDPSMFCSPEVDFWPLWPKMASSFRER